MMQEFRLDSGRFSASLTRSFPETNIQEFNGWTQVQTCRSVMAGLRHKHAGVVTELFSASLTRSFSETNTQELNGWTRAGSRRLSLATFLKQTYRSLGWTRAGYRRLSLATFLKQTYRSSMVGLRHKHAGVVTGLFSASLTRSCVFALNWLCPTGKPIERQTDRQTDKYRNKTMSERDIYISYTNSLSSLIGRPYLLRCA